MPEFKTREKPRPIYEGREVRVTETKHIIQIVDVQKKCDNFSKIHRIDKYSYYTDFPDDYGEIHEYKLNENRSQNIAGIKKTQKHLRDLINNNFDGSANELFITLTYAENMQDDKKLYIDVKNYVKRLKYRYGDVDYIAVIEPQQRGAWHVHALLRFNDRESIYINNDKEMQPLWGHGFTKVRSMKDIDNIGAYLSAYLADLVVSDENASEIFTAIANGERLECVDREIDGKAKKIVKGARLHMYPSGINMYRCSRGIKKPETTQMKYKEIKEKIGSREADFSKTIDISDADGKRLNTITYENYNMKRKKSKSKKDEQ